MSGTFRESQRGDSKAIVQPLEMRGVRPSPWPSPWQGEGTAVGCISKDSLTGHTALID